MRERVQRNYLKTLAGCVAIERVNASTAIEVVVYEKQWEMWNRASCPIGGKNKTTAVDKSLPAGGRTKTTVVFKLGKQMFHFLEVLVDCPHGSFSFTGMRKATSFLVTIGLLLLVAGHTWGAPKYSLLTITFSNSPRRLLPPVIAKFAFLP